MCESVPVIERDTLQGLHVQLLKKVPKPKWNFLGFVMKISQIKSRFHK